MDDMDAAMHSFSSPAFSVSEMPMLEGETNFLTPFRVNHLLSTSPPR